MILHVCLMQYIHPLCLYIMVLMIYHYDISPPCKAIPSFHIILCVLDCFSAPFTQTHIFNSHTIWRLHLNVIERKFSHALVWWDSHFQVTRWFILYIHIYFVFCCVCVLEPYVHCNMLIVKEGQIRPLMESLWEIIQLCSDITAQFNYSLQNIESQMTTWCWISMRQRKMMPFISYACLEKSHLL